MNINDKGDKSLIVGLWGGPGSGKSTGASYIYSKLKMMGVSCELVTEFAKDLVYEGSTDVLKKSQMYVTSTQNYKLNRVVGKADVIVTDSPTPLGLAYLTDRSVIEPFTHICTREYYKNPVIDVFVMRSKYFSTRGRIHSKEESEIIDAYLYKYVNDAYHGGKSYQLCVTSGDESGYDKALSVIKYYIANNFNFRTSVVVGYTQLGEKVTLLCEYNYGKRGLHLDLHPMDGIVEYANGWCEDSIDYIRDYDGYESITCPEVLYKIYNMCVSYNY